MKNRTHIIERLLIVKAKNVIKKSRRVFDCYHEKKTLKILLIGYSGKSNIGAEARCSEIIIALKNMQLECNIEIGVLTLDVIESRRFFSDDIKLIHISTYFFNDLQKACSEYHLGVLVEGSCFTNVTSNIAALFFISAMSILNVQGKPCIAYGVEAGPLPKQLVKLLKRHSQHLFFIGRTETSCKFAADYQLQPQLGTDTAWAVVQKDDGWCQDQFAKHITQENKKPLLGISVINAFIRPIKPKLLRFLLGKLTGRWCDHYNKFYFYTNNAERRIHYQKYLAAIATASNKWIKETNGIPVLIEMEPMDKSCLEDLAKLINAPCIYLSSKEYNAVEMTALLRQLDILISSRYHAHVLSIPAGVPCVAISKDQRLDALFSDNQLAKFCLSSFDETLTDKLSAALVEAWNDRALIRNQLIRCSRIYQEKQVTMHGQVKNYIQQALHLHD